MKIYYAKIFHIDKDIYIYDMITNTIYYIDDNIFTEIDYFNNCVEIGQNYSNYLKYNNIRDITKPPKIEINHRYNRNIISSQIKNYVHMVIFSLTDRCNMRCLYCCYNDKYNDITQLSNMAWDTAKKTIDNIIKYSLNLQSLHFGFYGGECLLEFNNIKRCVEYIKEKNIGIKITFGLTTNGLLLCRKEIRDYFAEKKFSVLVSLDGPQIIHDRYRIDINKNKTYDRVIKNLQIWKEEHREYFYRHVSLNCVLCPPFNTEALNDYFNNLGMMHMFGGLNSSEYFESNIDNTSNRYREVYTECKHDIDVKKYVNISKYRNIHDKDTVEETYIIPGGPCIPGFNKLFVNPKGEYYPCEKIEQCEENNIGNVEDGINFDKIYNLIDNYIEVAKRKCDNCWAMRLCGTCFNGLKDSCEGKKRAIEKNLIQYVKEIKDDKKAIKILEDIIYSI